MSPVHLPPPGNSLPRPPVRQPPATARSRRRQPARGARMIALAASVVATGGVALGLAYTEGEFTGDEELQDEVTAPIESVEAESIRKQAATPSTASADGVQMGTAEFTNWGDVQVEVTLSGGQIVDVVAVQIPSGRLSSTINDQAEPLLEAQAIEMQSADLDIVSGATYTSIAYADSLQAALDQAAFVETQSLAGATS